jgi:hypothetical protein
LKLPLLFLLLVGGWILEWMVSLPFLVASRLDPHACLPRRRTARPEPAGRADKKTAPAALRFLSCRSGPPEEGK